MTDIKAALAAVSSPQVTLTEPLEAREDQHLPPGKHPQKDASQWKWKSPLQIFFFFTEEYARSYKGNCTRKIFIVVLTKLLVQGC